MPQPTEMLLSALPVLSVAATALAALLAWARKAPGRSVPAEAAPPTEIGPYRLLDRIASGAMGDVYRARHLGSGQVVALKLLSRNANASEQAQFEREATLGARICHPNSVAVRDHGQTTDGTRYLAMELLDGVSLEQLVARQGPQSPARVISISMQVAAALSEVHAQGLVHRDVKPSNILLCQGEDGSDLVKLLDYGLVKRVGEADGADPAQDPVVGTPLYISPEAITSPHAVDGRSDLYGLGNVAHYLLSGAPVFTGSSVVEVCGHHLLTPPEPLSMIVGWVIGSDLENLVLECLAKDPAARPASARELVERLERCADAGVAHGSIERGPWQSAAFPAARAA